MPKNGLNVSLNSYDDIFSTEETRQEEQREQVQQIPIDELYPFKDHPFKVIDDEAMQRTVESIKQLGVTNPLIARPRPDGGYEIISGHRRQHAAQLARLKTLPVIVRDMSDDAAVLLMVDSNLQREQILPSERAFAYKMKLDALKRQGARSDLTSSQVGMKLQALDMRICTILAGGKKPGEVYFAAIAPDMELTVITLDEAPDILPCFDESDASIHLPDTSLLLCYNPAQVLKMAGKRYLTGPVILVRTNMDGNFISLTIDDVYRFQKFLASHSVTLMADDQKLPCICIV